MKRLMCLVLLLLIVGIHATAQNAKTEEYRLGPDDVIDITVPGHSDIDKELDRTVVILPDGNISYPEVGQMHAAGKTSTEIEKEIQKVLAKTRKQVHVVVSIREIHSKRFRIVGAIRAPGSYDLKPNWHLLDIIAGSGGLTNQPVYITGKLIRADGQVRTLDLAQALAKPTGDANLPIENEDLIVLEEQEIHNQAHVMGQVGHPGAFDLLVSTTVLSLLTEAGGPTPQAALRRAYIQRGTTQIPLDLYKAIVEGKPDDSLLSFKLNPGDVLVIPTIRAQIAVMGTVHSPGYYALPENKNDDTVLKALGLAGGQLPEGDLHRVGVIRLVNGKPTAIPIDIQTMLKKGNMASNITLQPDDIVYVPDRKQPRSLSELFGPISALALLGFRPL